jgi:type II secretory pathway component PulF
MPLLSPALDDKLMRMRVSTDMRAQLYDEIAAMLENGKSLNETLAKAYEIACTVGSGARSPKAVMLYELKQATGAGKPFSSALKRWAPMMEYTLIAVGEETGDLLGAFKHVQFMHEKRGELVKTFILKVPYPVLLFVGAGAMLWSMSVEQIPQMLQIAPESEWSGSAWLLIQLAHLTTSYGLYAIAAVVLVITATIVSLSRWTGDLRYRADKFGPWKAYRQVQGAMFMLSYATLVAAGVNQDEALAMLIRNASPYLAERLNAARLGIARGRSFGQALRLAEYDFPDTEANAYIEMLSDLDGFPAALLKYSRKWMDRTVGRINAFLNVFFVAGILAVAGLGLIAITSTQQMTEITKKIQP